MAGKKSKHRSALTHIDGKGEARMVDVSAKPATERVAIAEGRVLQAAGGGSAEGPATTGGPYQRAAG